MAKTLLDSVNAILKRVGTISGDSGQLSSISDSARQRHIDVAVQVVNEGMDELYGINGNAAAKAQAESTVTLVTNQRDYTLASDLVELRWPFIDKTNNQYLWRYPGGYNAILIGDPEQDDTGLPHFAAISPVDSKIYLDTLPTSSVAGRVYTYQYDKDVSLTVALDEVPFNDTIWRAMVPAWVQLWKRELRNEFDGDLFNRNIGRAARYLSQNIPRDTWSPR